ncbi:MAG: lytic transglycosylase domain-containing protein [bacterium]|nr:lytic transglycosylase domain-containing protein [bacterium]
MARVLDAGRAAGLSLYLGPLGLPWDSAPDLPARAATSPRVTLNEAARHLALALAAERAPPAAGAPEPPPAGPGARARRWGPLVDRVAREEGLDPALAHAVVAVESAYDPAAVSPKDAVGLMQLMPRTAERFGLARERRGEPEANLRAGMRYLKWLLDYFGRDLALAVAGYNAGEGAVLKHGRRVPPYPETRTYVARVARQLALRAAPSPARSGVRP